MSPTQRSLQKLRAAGYLVSVVERWNSYVKIRQDLFGWMDLLAVRGNETIGVQCTTMSHVGERAHKIIGQQSADLWLEGGTRRILIHGWRKIGPRGKRKVWECHEREIMRDGVQTPTYTID